MTTGSRQRTYLSEKRPRFVFEATSRISSEEKEEEEKESEGKESAWMSFWRSLSSATSSKLQDTVFHPSSTPH